MYVDKGNNTQKEPDQLVWILAELRQVLLGIRIRSVSENSCLFYYSMFSPSTHYTYNNIHVNLTYILCAPFIYRQTCLCDHLYKRLYLL